MQVVLVLHRRDYQVLLTKVVEVAEPLEQDNLELEVVVLVVMAVTDLHMH